MKHKKCRTLPVIRQWWWWWCWWWWWFGCNRQGDTSPSTCFELVGKYLHCNDTGNLTITFFQIKKNFSSEIVVNVTSHRLNINIQFNEFNSVLLCKNKEYFWLNKMFSEITTIMVLIALRTEKKQEDPKSVVAMKFF